jgi:hypothetical protein
MAGHDDRLGVSRGGAAAGIVVRIEAVGPTAGLGCVPAAGHRAITGRRRSTTISEGISAIFGKQRKWSHSEHRGDRWHVQHSSEYSTPARE